MEILVLSHAVATWFMAGVIWYVQGVHYPLMAAVGPSRFVEYEAAHTRRTTRIVAPAMGLEALTAVALVALRPSAVPPWQLWLGLLLVVVIWVSTVVAQVPQHRRLAAGFDAAVHSRLVASNRIRVFAWSFRAVLVGGWLG